MDIGVHVYEKINQRTHVFISKVDDKGMILFVNPNEQIITEKLISLARFGEESTRYKDIYDIYTLLISLENFTELFNIINLFLSSNKYPFSDISTLTKRIAYTLNDINYSNECSSFLSNVSNTQYSTMKETIIKILYQLTHEDNSIYLNNKERDSLLENLDNPPEPNDNLKKLM